MSKQSRPLPPSDTADKFVLRLPGGMRERIKDIADKNNRSMNAEIIATLEQAYPARSTFTDFMREWVAPIAEAKTTAEKSQLVDAANFEAELHHKGLRVGLDASGMRPYIVFVGEDIEAIIKDDKD
ncbi:Arc family DNA-binding protein [Brucella anthropi]|uniref:Arc family DNA-binding protein n=1 Tax=Brucella anthropi TaxID=529 RepID=UPI003D99684B